MYLQNEDIVHFTLIKNIQFFKKLSSSLLYVVDRLYTFSELYPFIFFLQSSSIRFIDYSFPTDINFHIQLANGIFDKSVYANSFSIHIFQGGTLSILK